jgi:hypothetical protein
LKNKGLSRTTENTAEKVVFALEKLPQGLNRLLKKSKKQIPRGLKPPRDDKNKGLNGTLRQAQGRL